MRWLAGILLGCVAALPAAGGNWPTLHGDAARSGHAADALEGPAAVAWARGLADGPIATAVEPVVADGRVFVGSANGVLYALSAADGAGLWAFDTGGPILHAAAWADGRVYVGSVAGHLHCLDAATGAEHWRFDAGRGGFAASPAVVDGTVYLGSRAGTFFAIDDAGDEPRERWRLEAESPIWQTAAVAAGTVYFMAEDRVARAVRAEDGEVLWQRGPVGGYRARDYYPCVFGDYVVFRTSPAAGAEEPMARGNRALAQASGLGEEIDGAEAAAIHAGAAGDVPRETLDRESAAVGALLDAHPTDGTFHVFHARTGESVPAGLLWAGGCGGVPTPPARTADGRVIVLWRSLWSGWLRAGEWSFRGSSPQHGFGVLDPAGGRITRLPPEPPGDYPWGVFPIADEHVAIQVAGPPGRERLYLVHQGSVAAMDLQTRRIEVLLAARDTWGGYPCLPWAGSEWHGPARGGLAFVDGRAYGVFGSRVIALGPRAESAAPELPPVERPAPAPAPARLTREAARALLAEQVEAYLDAAPWAPLPVVLGKSGVVQLFAQSHEAFVALAEAYPWLSEPQRTRVRGHLLEQLESHPPYDPQRCWYEPGRGTRREGLPEAAVASAVRPPAAGIGGVYGVWLLAESAEAHDQVRPHWPAIRPLLQAAATREFRIDPVEGHPAMNRTLAGLAAYVQLAERFGDDEAARLGRHRLDEALAELDAYWAERPTFPDRRYFAGVTPAAGDVLLLLGSSTPRAEVQHASAFACLADLTPDLAGRLSREPARGNVLRLLAAIDRVGPAWYVTGAERYLHRGENHQDVPDEPPGILLARAQVAGEPFQRLAAYADLPLCPGDLLFLRRLAAILAAGD